MILHGNFLRAKVFLSCDWKPCARLDCSVIRDNQAKLFRHISHDYHHSTCRTTAVLLVHPIACESTYFNAFGIFIQKVIYTLASGHLSLFMLFIHALLPSSFVDFFQSTLKFCDALKHFIFVLVEFQFFRVHAAKLSIACSIVFVENSIPKRLSRSTPFSILEVVCAAQEVLYRKNHCLRHCREIIFFVEKDRSA